MIRALLRCGMFVGAPLLMVVLAAGCQNSGRRAGVQPCSGCNQSNQRPNAAYGTQANDGHNHANP